MPGPGVQRLQCDPPIGAGGSGRGQSLLVAEPVRDSRFEHPLGDPGGGLHLLLQQPASGAGQPQRTLAALLVQCLDQPLGLQPGQRPGQGAATEPLPGQLADGGVDGVAVQRSARQRAQDQQLGVGGLHRSMVSYAPVSFTDSTHRVLSDP